MEDVITNKYECIRLEIEWANDDDTPIDLGGREAVILDANPLILKQAAFTILDGDTGKTQLFVSSAIAAKLNNGRANWIRLGVRIPGGCIDSLPAIWINVK